MMRRFFPALVALALIISASSALAQNQPILDALHALNNMPERFNTPEQAEATAREFFQLVQSASGNENAIGVLKELKRQIPEAEWDEN